MKYLPLALALFLAHCVKSTAIVDPVTNKASVGSTAATQGTLTLSINLSGMSNGGTIVLNGQGFGAMLFQNGIIKAALNQGTGATDASAMASILMRGVDGSMAMTSSTATLPNGVYDFYFSINNAALPNYTAYGANCTGAGFLTANGSGTNFIYAARDQVTISGDKTLSLKIASVIPGKAHTFQLGGTTPVSKNFMCYMLDANATSVASTYYLAKYTGATNASGDASTTLDTCSGGNYTVYLPIGNYKYFCYIDSSPIADSIFGNTGDKVASGIANVTGGATTYLTNTSFSTIP